MQKLSDDNPSSMIFRNRLPAFLHNLGDVVQSRGRAAEAKDLYERAIALEEPPARVNPLDPEYVGKLVGAIWRHGLALR